MDERTLTVEQRLERTLAQLGSALDRMERKLGLVGPGQVDDQTKHTKNNGEETH